MIDYIGKKFGRITVKKNLPPDLKKFGKYSGDRFLVVCDCGTLKSVNKRAVLRGRVRSCGCLQRSIAKTHGISHTGIYRVWMGMRQRCNNKDHWLYPRYGGRGIKICDEWVDDVLAFYLWAINNGYKEGLTIDRKDNDSGYSPKNCRFVTLKKNLNNTSKTIILTIKNKKIPLQEAAEIYNIKPEVLYQRIKKLKWDHEEAVFIPVRKLKRKKKYAN